ncbi:MULTISPECIES: ABC transporter substrate-binding protein [unclassified Halomonas]|uniref:ABC transporter substrate-binding protein n=1 Tax=unclassified Halomonas TaxID=2609666 RepID=UPI001CF5E361|nr:MULTISPECIES: extracellular solute-binding protein [unclassified Halomonas]MCA8863224.1 extracellular solute-binding protein [Halomonas sp. SBBP1]UZH09267.1 extracellular solute-binding protein [Halomonas sp. BDJS001]
MQVSNNYNVPCSRPRHLALAVAVVAALGSVSAAADTTVTVLRVESSSAEKRYYDEVVAEFESQHPDINVEFEYLANEAYKTRLPTMLQSSQRPDIYYTWGGEGLRDQVDAGFVRDLTEPMRDGWQDIYPTSAVLAFTLDDRVYGAPLYATVVGIWANTALTEPAGVNVETIKTWEDFENAVVALREEGITPLVVGGQDGWPLHFYWGSLVTRLAGGEGIEAAKSGDNGGFNGEPFVRAGEMLQALVELDPFQSGFMATSYERASGMFGDGEAAFHVMGDWDYLPSKQRSASGEGVPDEDLRFIPFPTVAGGEGNEQSFGGMNGFAVTRDAPDEAVEFLRFLLNAENQRKAAATGIFVPVAEGSAEALETPYARRVAEILDESEFHQVFLDQALGTSVGATINDISGDLAQGVITPEEAAARIEEAWQFR